ncbi:hypothetical protein Tco_1061144 [Tanacetum coccineum]
MNITSPSSSLEQTNFVLEDWGTNPSDSSIEFNFRTCSVVIEANGLGCGCGLELVSLGLSSSYSTSGSLTLDSLGCLGWIVMALIKIWICVEHCGSIVGTVVEGTVRDRTVGLEPDRWVSQRLFCSGLKVYHLPPASSVVSEQDELLSSVRLDFRARLDGGRMYSGHLEAKFSMMLLEHQLIIAEFCVPFRWKELSKESGSKILPCGDGSCWKAFKPIASLIA